MSPTLTLEQEILLGAALDNLSSAAAADRLARASRVLSSIQSGSCVVLPAPGSFGRSTPAVRRACESARLARTASRPPRTKPKAAGAAQRRAIVFHQSAPVIQAIAQTARVAAMAKA